MRGSTTFFIALSIAVVSTTAVIAQSSTGAPDKRVDANPSSRQAWIPPNDDASDRCDHMAASPLDTTRPKNVAAVAMVDIDTAIALQACLAATKTEPTHARRLYQLGRVFEAAGRTYDAITTYSRAASYNHIEAIHALAVLYSRGAPNDRSYAIELLERSGSMGFAPSMLLLGRMYREGTAAPFNFAAAKSWLEKAVASDELGARHEFARLLTAANNPGGIDWDGAALQWRKLVDRKDTDAALSLALAIKKGQVKPLTSNEMEEAFKIALLSGRYLPAIEFAEAIALGKGIKRDQERALRQAYEAYDRARGADHMSEDAWIVLQKQSAHFVIDIIRRNNLRPRDESEHARMISDFGDDEMFEYKVATDCRAPASVNLYIWDWKRPLPPTLTQYDFTARVHGCRLDPKVRAIVNEAYRKAIYSGKSFRNLAKADLQEISKPGSAQEGPPLPQIASANRAENNLALPDKQNSTGQKLDYDENINSAMRRKFDPVVDKDAQSGLHLMNISSIGSCTGGWYNGAVHQELLKQVLSILMRRFQQFENSVDLRRVASTYVQFVAITGFKEVEAVGGLCEQLKRIPNAQPASNRDVNVQRSQLVRRHFWLLAERWQRDLPSPLSDANAPRQEQERDAQLEADSQAAERSGAVVRYELAVRYYEGRGRPIKKELAADWLLVAHKLGHAPSGEYLFNRVEVEIILKRRVIRVVALNYWFGAKYRSGDIGLVADLYESEDLQKSLVSLAKVIDRKAALRAMEGDLATMAAKK